VEIAWFHAVNFFTAGDRATDIHFIGGWVGSEACLAAVKRNVLHLPRIETQPVACSYTDCGVPAMGGLFVKKYSIEGWTGLTWISTGYRSWLVCLQTGDRG
jgi:hypothetical protein